MNSKSENVRQTRSARGLYALYLYYRDQNSRLRIYEFWDPTGKYDGMTFLTAALDNAVSNGNNPPPYITDDYADYPKRMMMRRKSYVVFAFDTGTYSQPPDDIDIKGWDHFGISIPGSYTFSAPKAVVAQTSSGQNVPIIYVENWMTSSGSNKDLRYKEGERFKFSVMFSKTGQSRVEDSGGTNMGPPVPPPSRKR